MGQRETAHHQHKSLNFKTDGTGGTNGTTCVRRSGDLETGMRMDKKCKKTEIGMVPVNMNFGVVITLISKEEWVFGKEGMGWTWEKGTQQARIEI